MGHRYQKTFHRSTVGFFLSVLGVVWAASPAVGQIHVLNRQIERIDTMIERNEEVQQQIRGVLDRLGELAGAYSAEIRDGQANRGIRTLASSHKSPRMNADLELLQRIGAYELLLNQRIAELNAAKERLRFLRRRAIDDVKLMQTLAGLNADELLGQIDQTLDRNQLLIDRPAVNAATLKPVAADAAWRRALAHR